MNEGAETLRLGARVRGYLAPLLTGSPAWSALLDAPVAIGVYRLDGTLLLLNATALDLFGYPLSLVLERGWIALSQPDPKEQEVTRRNIADQFSARGTTRHRRTIRFADGTFHLVEITSTRVSLPDGEPAVMSTITEPAGVRTAEAGGERGYVEIVEDLGDVLFRIDASTHRVLFVNRAIERFTGFAPEAFYRDAKLLATTLTPEARPVWESALAQVTKGDARQFDLVLTHKDGREAILAQALYPIRSADGHVKWIEGSGRDITTVRQLEVLKSRNEERASLERLKSQLLANVSHELRTPLVSIKGYNDLLLRGALGPLTPRQRRGLEIAGANTERLIELIETLLDFARREEERLELHVERFDLRLAVEDAVSALRERIASRNLILHVSLGNKPIEVKGDRARLAQVFRALVGNAEKFTESADGGRNEIRVEARVVGDMAEVSVTDCGIGIPEELFDKIFDRFYQVDASSTRRFGGAGLGLAFARELVSLHGGRIRVESTEGRGSTFTITMPLPTSDSGKFERIAPPRPVVLVGADETTWNALRPLLDSGQLGPLDVFGAHTEGEVVRRARRHRPDLVVLAFAEPNTLVAELKHGSDTSNIPVVVVTPAASETHGPVGRADLVAGQQDGARLIAGLQRLLGRAVRPGRTTRPPQVVIVEDEVEILDFTRFVLEREGYEVVCLQTGQEALATVNPETNLVILDIALEGDDGIEICRTLKTRPLTKEVPILIMTAMSGDEVKRVSMSAGAAGYLVKPFGVDEFLRQVRLHVNRLDTLDERA
jgi:PAS domain S-box-containing protein